MRLSEPFRVGWESVRANAVPMAVLWTLAALTVIGYYFVPGFARLLEPLRCWQTESGWVAAFLNRVIFCGLLPGVFLVSVKAIRPLHPWATTLAYCLWSGPWGILCDWFFTLQTMMFGSGTDVTTIALKLSVEYLVWTAIICVPPAVVFFFWLSRDFSLARTRREWPRHFIRDACVPLFVSDICVWVPVSAVVYLFPLPLQVQLVGFAGSFWMLVGLYVAAHGFARGKSVGKCNGSI